MDEFMQYEGIKNFWAGRVAGIEDEPASAEPEKVEKKEKEQAIQLDFLHGTVGND